MIAEVLVQININVDKTFTYLIPNKLLDKVLVGVRVKVPFGKTILEGFVLKINNLIDTDYQMKKIIDVIDDHPVLNKELLDLGIYLSKKTLTNLITCYQTMLPSALKAKEGFIVNKKYDTYIKLNNDNDINVTSIKQQEIINLLQSKGEVLKKEVSNISPSSLKTLLSKNIVIEIKKEVYRIDDTAIKEKSSIVLNDEQQVAVDAVVSSFNTFKPYLLFGVTGSGKTEVYMHIIEEALKNNKKALVLVPEISLTPQLISVFKKRFGSNIAVLHSKLNNGEKYDEWRKIEKDEVSIVIGARSAVFAPLSNIGVIIADEEHSDTYKQENAPRYSAIDVCLYRSKIHNCPVILGSATPSIESYTRAKLNVYNLLTLKNRVNKNLPKVNLIDMKDEIKKGSNIISSVLKDKINNRLQNQEQVILLLNRRGFSTIVTCHNCGFTMKCPNCDIPLTFHKISNTMRCHYCGYATYKIKKCPECKSEDINEFGLGTEKLEEIVKMMFKCNVVRMDVDTTSKKGAHAKILDDFKNQKYNILIGTQMIAKGLDFPNVTLVGVINGDASLNIPDFRSGERTYSLLNQVAGRAGRGEKKGEVVIQGFNIDHYSIVCASNHDYLSFYNMEMNLRKKLKYPPYVNLCMIKISGKNLDKITLEANKIHDYLVNKKDKEQIILGPNASSIPKINNIYYLQILIKYKDTNKLLTSLKYIKNRYSTTNTVKIDIDINPIRI